MTQKNLQGMTNHKTRANALERIEALETTYRVLGTQIRDALNKLSERLTLNEKIMNAVTELLGQEVVENKVKQHHIEGLEAEVARVSEAVQKAVDSGRILPLDSVKTENCLVVTQSHNADGKLQHPSRIYNDITEYVEEARNLLIDKVVGDKVELSDKSVLTVLEIWCQNLTPPAAEPPAEEPKAE